MPLGSSLVPYISEGIPKAWGTMSMVNGMVLSWHCRWILQERKHGMLWIGLYIQLLTLQTHHHQSLLRNIPPIFQLTNYTLKWGLVCLYPWGYIQLHDCFSIQVRRRDCCREKRNRTWKSPSYGSLGNLISCDCTKTCPKKGIWFVLQQSCNLRSILAACEMARHFGLESGFQSKVYLSFPK